MSKTKLKKLLIYMFHKYNEDNLKIMDELVNNNDKITDEEVQKWFKENEIKLSDYVVFWEKRFNQDEMIYIYRSTSV